VPENLTCAGLLLETPPLPVPWRRLSMQVQYWAPQSAGAGVILVMAYLNGNHVPNLLRLRTLVSKFVGTVCAVASGLPFGPEGPMVHMGACVASVITYAQCSECGKPARQGSGGLTRR
jgi:H+/Cl- antiporter ClcA